VEKCLVFAPDAMGNHLYRHSPDVFEDVVRLAPVATRLQSVFPSVTPVCFASMFTGAAPAEHGVVQYEKPVLACDTLFDALLRAGKRVAIVAVKDCSIDRIFRGRALDYFSESYDPAVTKRVVSLLEAGRHDFILAYHQEYDDVMHATGPFSPQAVQAAKNNVAGFVRMVRAVDEHWRRYRRMIVFTPDHGAHWNAETGKGSHGLDIPDDMELNHFYGFAGGG
jgi:hypothetical protein